MKFSEWWELRHGNKLQLDKVFRYHTVKQWAAVAYEDGIKEGLRRAQVASKASSQGGDSWKGAVDRQGGSFTQDELDDTGWR